MSTDSAIAGVDPQEQADSEAVLRQLMDGTPLDPEVGRRIEERARLITEDPRRRNVEIDIEKLIRDTRDEI